MYRLIYKSDSAVKMNWGIVGGILTSSTRNNQRSGLTGILFLGKRHFLQFLEGEFDAVNKTFQRISHDHRHRNIRIVSFEVIEQRQFRQWEMRGVGVFDFDPPVSKMLIHKYGEEDGEIRFPEEGGQALSLAHDLMLLPDLPEWSLDKPHS